MKKLLAYINMIRETLDTEAEEHWIYYSEEDGKWYESGYGKDREITLDKLHDLLVGLAQNLLNSYDKNYELQEKLIELIGEDAAVEFVEEVNEKYR